jgi:segregation and condensation protein B
MESLEIISRHIEALIFCSENSIDSPELLSCLQKSFPDQINSVQLSHCLKEIEFKYKGPVHIFELTKISGGYKFLTKKEYVNTLSILINQKNQKKLSQSALETLSIVCYKQPVTKSEIEEIRGVNCDYSIQKLLEKDLIQIDGKSDFPGRPLIYSTGKPFMEYFKLRSLDQLPQLKDLIVENS